MSYIGRYEKFINSLKNQNLTEKFERHHIIPKSFGGSNDRDNLIKLTYRQHYIAHWMLWKIYGGKMANAFFFMNQAIKYKKIGSKAYEKLRTEAGLFTSERMSGKKISKEHIEIMRHATTERMKDPAVRENLRQKRMNQVITKESYEKQAKIISSLVWMNDNKRSYRVLPKNVQIKLDDGLSLGRLINYMSDEYKNKRKEIARLQWSALKAIGHKGHLKRIQSCHT